MIGPVDAYYGTASGVLPAPTYDVWMNGTAGRFRILRSQSDYQSVYELQTGGTN